MSEEKHAGGRPSSYRDEYCQGLIDHMKNGYSYETFGSTIGVCRATVYNWEIIPEFLDAKKRAFDACMLTWERIGVAQALGDKKKGKGSTAAWIFNMKNRFQWTDKQELIDREQEDLEWLKD